jgi:hypothetical protein
VEERKGERGDDVVELLGLKDAHRDRYEHSIQTIGILDLHAELTLSNKLKHNMASLIFNQTSSLLRAAPLISLTTFTRCMYRVTRTSSIR